MSVSQFTLETFWTKIAVGNTDECWSWLRSTNGRYGHVRYGKGHMYAHRLAWMLTNGEIPDGLYVCHKCDNTLCCNPCHLFLGTAQDNNDDKMQKGRFRGTPRTLSADQARYVRRHPEKRTCDLARELGVPRGIINNVRRGRCYKEIR